MKQKRSKKVVAFLSALAMGVVLIANTSMTANADESVTSEQVQEIVERNTKYRELLQEEVWGPEGDGPAYGFGLTDINSDDNEELIAFTFDPAEAGWNNPNAIINWNAGEIEWTWDDWVLCSMYYSPSTGNFMIVDGTEPESYATITIFKYATNHEVWGNKEPLLEAQITNGTYVNSDNEECTETEIAEIEAKIQEYMPEKVLLEAPYEITEENLNTYLPTDEEVVRQMLEEKLVKEVTTEQITLKVGEAWGVSTENIDKLLEEAGYDYKSATPKIFHGDAVEMDGVYLVPASGVGVVDAAGGNTLEMLYVTDAEFGELLEQWQNGELEEKYKTEVMLVDEAEGYCYYARAEKNGTTTITIPSYSLESGKTITVHIPVLVEAVSQESGDEEVDEEVADSKIESTTDNSIIIDNTNSVLPAGTVLQSAKLESGEVYTNAEKLVKENVETLVKYAVYELDLTDGDGVKIQQLNGKVSVTMNIPFTMSENTTLKVYRVDNGTLVNCPATVSDGKVIFETDHFSTYIFAEEATLPSKGDASSMLIVAMLMTTGALLCGFAAYGKKSKITA